MSISLCRIGHSSCPRRPGIVPRVPPRRVRRQLPTSPHASADDEASHPHAFLGTQILRDVCLLAMPRSVLEQGTGPSTESEVYASRIRPLPDTPLFLYGLQWCLEMYHFNR